MSKIAKAAPRNGVLSGDAGRVRRALELVIVAQSIATEAVTIAQRAIDASDLLSARNAEAEEIVSGLLQALEQSERSGLIYELRPKAQRFLATKEKARQARCKTDATVWSALVDEINAGTPMRARAKRIASNLGLSHQYVLKVVARLRKNTWPNDF